MPPQLIELQGIGQSERGRAPQEKKNCSDAVAYCVKSIPSPETPICCCVTSKLGVGVDTSAQVTETLELRPCLIYRAEYHISKALL